MYLKELTDVEGLLDLFHKDPSKRYMAIVTHFKTKATKDTADNLS